MSRVGRTVRPMETAVIRPLPSAVAAEPSPLPTRVRVEGDRIVVERLVLADPASPRSWPSARATTGRPSSSAPCASACSRSRTPA